MATWYRLNRHTMTIEAVSNVIGVVQISHIIIQEWGYYDTRTYTEPIVTDHSLLFDNFQHARRVAVENLVARIVTAKQNIADMEALITRYTVTGLAPNGGNNVQDQGV